MENISVAMTGRRVAKCGWNRQALFGGARPKENGLRKGGRFVMLVRLQAWDSYLAGTRFLEREEPLVCGAC